MVVALLSLVFAMAGTGFAASFVITSSKQIKNGAVTGADVKNSSLTGSDVQDKSLTAKDFSGSVQGATGATGATGAKGDKGDTGLTGARGPSDAYYVFNNTTSVDVNPLNLVLPAGKYAVTGSPGARPCDQGRNAELTTSVQHDAEQFAGGGGQSPPLLRGRPGPAWRDTAARLRGGRTVAPRRSPHREGSAAGRPDGQALNWTAVFPSAIVGGVTSTAMFSATHAAARREDSSVPAFASQSVTVTPPPGVRTAA